MMSSKSLSLTTCDFFQLFGSQYLISTTNWSVFQRQCTYKVLMYFSIWVWILLYDLTKMYILVSAGAAHSLSGVSVFRPGPRLVFLQSPAERPAVWPAVPSAQHRRRVSGTDSHTCFTSLQQSGAASSLMLRGRGGGGGEDAPCPRTSVSASGTAFSFQFAKRAAPRPQEALVCPWAPVRNQD